MTVGASRGREFSRIRWHSESWWMQTLSAVEPRELAHHGSAVGDIDVCSLHPILVVHGLVGEVRRTSVCLVDDYPELSLSLLIGPPLPRSGPWLEVRRTYRRPRRRRR